MGKSVKKFVCMPSKRNIGIFSEGACKNKLTVIFPIFFHLPFHFCYFGPSSQLNDLGNETKVHKCIFAICVEVFQALDSSL